MVRSHPGRPNFASPKLRLASHVCSLEWAILFIFGSPWRDRRAELDGASPGLEANSAEFDRKAIPSVIDFSVEIY